MTRTTLAALRHRTLVTAICAAGLTLFTMTNALRADYVINDFNSADEAAAWYFETWSTATATASWDPTVDSLGNSASGSLKIVIDFDAAGGKNDANFSRAFATPVDATPATLFIADIRVAEESPDTPWGDEGYLQLVGRSGDNWDWTPQHADNINSDGNWIPIDKAPVAPFDDFRAFTFQLWGGGAQALQGQTTIWLDNIRFLGDFPEPAQDGDTDGDRDVDLDDLNNVRNNFGTSPPPTGDTDGDNDVDLDDLNAVRNNFGAGPTLAVPEPSAAMLALCGLGATIMLCRATRKMKM